MEFDELCEKAFKKQELEQYANLAEKYAYLQMCNLFENYSQEKISKEQASKQKAKIKMEYENYQRKIADYWDLYKKQNDTRRELGQYIIDIEKTTDQYDLLDKSLLLIEKIINDNSFRDRNIKKVDN